MIFHDAAAAYTAVYEAIVAWLQVAATAAVIVVVSTALLIAPPTRARDEAQQGTGEPHEVSGDSRAAEGTPEPRDARTGPRGRRAPTWAHQQPINHEEAA